MISHGLWRSPFAADPQAVGRALQLDGIPVEIIGVLPKDFMLPTLTEADVLSRLALNEATERAGRTLRVFARVKPAVTVKRAVAQLQPHFERALVTVPVRFRIEISFRVRPVRDRQIGDVRTASKALFGAVVAVLLIACANITSLLLARAVACERELAVRTALGASRLRLARQTLTESVIVSAIGGAAGCALAWALLRVFVAVAPAALPRLEEAAIDTRVLLFTLGATLASGLLVGIAPALRRSRSMAVGGWRSTSRSRAGLRSALVTLKIAFSMVLLTGAGLLLRSLWKLESVPLGIQTDRVVTARFVLGRQRYSSDEQQLTFFRELERQPAAAPGVEAVAISDSMPPSGGMRGGPLAAMEIEGCPRRPEGTGGMAGWRYIVRKHSPDFNFRNQEPPAGCRSAAGGSSLRWFTVAGVVGDMRRQGLENEPVAQMFEPLAANPPRRAVLLVRTSIADPLRLAEPVQAVVRRVEKHAPVYGATTIENRLDSFLTRRRFQTSLLIGFSEVALLMAAIGIFGLIQYSVTTRTLEIGIRMAVGAQAREVFGTIMREGLTLSFTGLVLGLLGGFWLGRAGSSLLFGVTAADPLTFTTVSMLLIAVAAAACYLPARRAMKVDPVVALREE
jgi:ABC-type lipoprotein release transport system permease subunit